MRAVVMSAVLSGLAAAASAQYSVTGFSASLWQASDELIGVAGYTIEDFEDAALSTGLQISVVALDGSYGPTSTLPNVFHPVADDPFGDVFDSGVWDGTAELLNTYDNLTSVYTFQDHWNSIVTLHFAQGVSSVGFSLAQMQLNATLVIDGHSVGTLPGLAGFSFSGERQGYIRIDGCNTTMYEIQIVSQNPDGWAIDHLAFRPADGTGCPPDFNNDCAVDFFDVQAFLAAFAAQDPSADINADNMWDFFDVLTYLGLFSAGCP